MKVCHAICLRLRYMEDLILTSVSKGVKEGGKTYEVRFRNKLSHLTLPERRDEVEGEIYRGCEELIAGRESG